MTAEPTSASPAADPGGDGDRDRKAEHIELALEERMQVRANPFDRLAFEHRALPEIDFEEIDVSCTFLNRSLSAPILISSMTGGTEEAATINRNLAQAAQERGIALAVGSQRKALEDPVLAATFEVRQFAPDVPILGNLGAVQLNYGFGVEHCRQAVEMIDADALILHLNPLQEAIQPEGQTRFASLLPKIAEVTRALSVPVVAKEVGSGIAESVGHELARAGVRVIDTAGVGGTSWARIEAARAEDVDIGELFADWGISTVDSIRALARVPGVAVVGSGGVRHGLDIAKAVALGADLGGMAYRFLAPARHSAEAVVEKIDRTVRELKIAMFCVGARDLAALHRGALTSR